MSTPPPGTAWQRIARDIAGRIASGETPVGSKIASHQQLIRQHGASLGTIKRAVEHLQEAGVLQGVQGSGVFVRRVPSAADMDFEGDPPQDRDNDLAGLREELEGLREQMAVLEDATVGRVGALEQSLAKVDSTDGDLRDMVGLLQAHLIELYARMGQPYPGHVASAGERQGSRPGRRRTADGMA